MIYLSILENKMAKFKKLPVTIEAEKFLGLDKAHEENGVVSQANVSRYSLSVVHCKKCEQAFSKHGAVETLEGEHIVCPGDMMIKGVAGEFYPVKSDIFAQTYEPVD